MKWQLNTYLLYFSWVDSILIILVYHLLHSWNHHFLSKWQELTSSYSSSLEGSSLNGESLIFNCSHILLVFLWVELKVITSFWYTFFAWMNPIILGGHSRWLSPLLHSSILLYLFLKVILWCMFFPLNSLVK